MVYQSNKKARWQEDQAASVIIVCVAWNLDCTNWPCTSHQNPLTYFCGLAPYHEAELDSFDRVVKGQHEGALRLLALIALCHA